MPFKENISELTAVCTSIDQFATAEALLSSFGFILSFHDPEPDDYYLRLGDMTRISVSEGFFFREQLLQQFLTNM